mmetsp:Transcript_32905/g.53397  ORF Transcript_32905/g.53397 Transcript_32905/m.53397 type:complete len:205 (-) Transcript_32905:1432-2046(-)
MGAGLCEDVLKAAVVAQLTRTYWVSSANGEGHERIPLDLRGAVWRNSKFDQLGKPAHLPKKRSSLIVMCTVSKCKCSGFGVRLQQLQQRTDAIQLSDLLSTPAVICAVCKGHGNGTGNERVRRQKANQRGYSSQTIDLRPVMVILRACHKGCSSFDAYVRVGRQEGHEPLHASQLADVGTVVSILSAVCKSNCHHPLHLGTVGQ